MRVFSGIQPTGVIHLGNYFGALIHWVELQNAGHDCFYSIVNQHAITQPQDPGELSRHTLNVAATLLAIGIDPEKSTLFVQSDVPAHAQLAWVLNCLAPLGQMERMIQFKEKSERNPTSVNFGLLSYPILQAADILLYKAELVPVGKDQDQHLELTRLLANNFNNRYGAFFPEPKTLHGKTTKVIGIDGAAKMSKSMNNYIGLTESPEEILKKLRSAATDPARVTRKDPGNPFICNIYTLHTLFSSQKDQEWVVDGCQTANIGCMDCKQLLFKNMDSFLRPIREKYQTVIQDQKKLIEILAFGAEKAGKEAQKTLEAVYDKIGFLYK